MKKFLKDYNHPKLDASENAFLRQELQHMRKMAYEIAFPENDGRKLVPVDHSVHNGAETVSFDVLDSVGKSRIGGGYSDEGPRVDVSMSSNINRIIPIVNSYGYSMQEVRNSMMSGRSLPSLRARTARQVIDSDLGDLLLLGSAVNSLAGLFTQSGTTTYTIPNGAVSGTPDWDDAKTPDEIVKDMHAAVNAIVEGTNKVEKPDTMVLPLTAFNYVHGRRMGDGSDKTILKYFMETSPYIKNVESSIDLESNAAWTGRRLCVYNKSPLKLQGIIPQEFEQLAPEVKGFETVVNCHARFGGVEVYYPKSICYADNF